MKMDKLLINGMTAEKTEDGWEVKDKRGWASGLFTFKKDAKKYMKDYKKE